MCLALHLQQGATLHALAKKTLLLQSRIANTRSAPSDQGYDASKLHDCMHELIFSCASRISASISSLDLLARDES